MNDPFAEPSDTRQAILGAAFRALCEHGYANVTIQRIGDEFDKSPSLVYHHYDGKDDLLIDLLGFLLDEFEASVADGPVAEPPGEDAATAGEDAPEMAPEEAFDRSAREQLDGYLTAAVDPASLDDAYAPDERFVTVMTELRSQAASDEAYRDHFDRSDRVFGEYLERLVREAAADVAGGGAEVSGDEAEAAGDDASDATPDAVTASEVAATLQTFATGGMFRWATTNDGAWVGESRAGIDRYLEAMLPLVETADSEE